MSGSGLRRTSAAATAAAREAAKEAKALQSVQVEDAYRKLMQHMKTLEDALAAAEEGGVAPGDEVAALVAKMGKVRGAAREMHGKTRACITKIKATARTAARTHQQFSEDTMAVLRACVVSDVVGGEGRRGDPRGARALAALICSTAGPGSEHAEPPAALKRAMANTAAMAGAVAANLEVDQPAIPRAR